MLLGEFRHNIDTKGRLAVPVKFRAELNEGIIITRGVDHCLFVFDMAEWQKLVAKLTSLSLMHGDSRAFVRLMLSGAVDTKLDAQGRVLVPDYLRNFAALDKEVVIAGLYNRVEIWNAANWDEYRKKTESSSEEIAEKLSQLGI